MNYASKNKAKTNPNKPNFIHEPQTTNYELRTMNYLIFQYKILALDLNHRYNYI